MNELEMAARMLSPETVPITINILPAAWLHYGEDLRRIVSEYPQFFPKILDLEKIRNKLDPQYRVGQWTDEWGCVWSNLIEGNWAYVTGHPLKSEEDIMALKIPDNRDGNLPHGFFYLRLLDLCGFEFAMELFADEEEPLQVLIDKVVTYNCYQIDVLLQKQAKRQDNFYSFGDDNGMQHGLAIGAERWRKYIKPAYKKMYSKIHQANPNAVIWMHTDGCIWEVMPDMIETGVTMINPQFGSNGLENLVEVCRRKQIIPIHLDIDCQRFPFATPVQLQEHVRECVQSFYLPEGGLALNVEFNYDTPLSNMAALLEALEKWRHYKG